jgi:hypothetical protein
LKASIVNVWKDGDSEIRVAITVPVTFRQWFDHTIRKVAFRNSNPKLVASARATGAKIIQSVISKEGK